MNCPSQFTTGQLADIFLSFAEKIVPSLKRVLKDKP